MSTDAPGSQPVPALFFARVERRYKQAEGALEILRGAD
ncbi:ABC transporter, partial [Methylobacterium hispanicum]